VGLDGLYLSRIRGAIDGSPRKILVMMTSRVRITTQDALVGKVTKSLPPKLGKR
jgi:hypothetical protein